MTVTIDLARADRLCVAAGVLGALRPNIQPLIDVALAAQLVGQEPPPEARLAAQLLRGWLPLRLHQPMQRRFLTKTKQQDVPTPCCPSP